MSWTPGPRPTWVDHLNDLGRRSGDPRTLVPLDAGGLVDAAVGATGLDDFGGDGWRDGFARLVEAADAEAELHLVGRLLLRSEIVRCLVNRLRIAQALRDDPAVADEAITAPIVVTGMARSGTSILHELLAQDPGLRAPRTWEVLHPCPTDDVETRLASAHRDVTFWDEIVPEYRTMHENGGDVPQECIFITAHEFASDLWSGNQWVPSYARWVVTTDLVPAYRYHRTFLQLLQRQGPPGRWVLKAPSHLSALPALFAVYPDARVIVTHRDPLKVAGSLTSLSCTLRWMRSDVVPADRIATQTAYGLAYLLDQLVAQRESGVVPETQVVDVRYADLMADPWSTLRRVYEQLGTELTAEGEERMRAYLAAKPKDRHGAHGYSFADTGLDPVDTRRRFEGYQRRFDVPDEV